MTFTKLSLLWFYHRIFTSEIFKKVWLGLGIISALWGIGAAITMVFVCWPVHAFWDRSIDGRCMNLRVLMYTVSTPNLGLDFLLLVLPLVPLSKLKVDKAKKIALMSVFLLGGL